MLQRKPLQDYNIKKKQVEYIQGLDQVTVKSSIPGEKQFLLKLRSPSNAWRLKAEVEGHGMGSGRHLREIIINFEC